MGEVRWSPGQEEIITSRRKNLLVSAAAGSGKTTVMIERIARLITDPKEKIDIDRLLIVTFTRDAAANMKEKLEQRIDRMIDEDPSNAVLKRQRMLLPFAKITTIDSFCNSLVREFYYELDIDPSFRIADEAEMKMIREEVCADLLEKLYDEADEEFINLTESYCDSKNDDKLISLIMKLADAATSQGWPLLWLSGLKEELRRDSQALQLKEEWRSQICDICHEYLEGLSPDLDRMISLAGEDDKLEKVENFLKAESDMIISALSGSGYDELKIRVPLISFDRLNFPRGYDSDLKDQIKAVREDVKECIGRLKKMYFAIPEDKLLLAQRLSSRPLIKLLSITGMYLENLLEAKKSKNLYEFSDIAHFALEILTVRADDKSAAASKTALSLRERFAEIFIDEYQDSDMVQELIANVLIGEDDSYPYAFMVGDVKQSIYKFRMAKPELFISRSDKYESEETLGRLIRLGTNYRSTKSVIDSVNSLFRMCMHRSVGGVEYDKGAELVCSFTEQDESGRKTPEDKTELVITLPGNTNDAVTEEYTPGGEYEDGEDRAAEFSAEEPDKTERNARAAALIIRRMLDDKYLIRERDGSKRPAECGDFAILVRSPGKTAGIYLEELSKLNIPARSDAGRGYLGTYEISVIVSYLRLLDNPLQDIPLVAALHSVIGGMNEDELAKIRVFGGMNISYFECLKSYSETGEDEKLKEKAARFLDIYENIRQMNMTSDIDRVIAAVYEKTGFYLYCAALPGGRERLMNLDLLLEYAAGYEDGNYSGLFGFVKYIEKIKKNEDDLEEASLAEAGDSVRIMSIHKSKGLEYPVVILSDTQKKINDIDLKGDVIINSDHGIAAKSVQLDKRVKTETIGRSLLCERIKRDMVGEELRILYVATTRAMQKLIIIGAADDRDRLTEKWEAASRSSTLSPLYILNVTGYLDLIGPAAVRNPQDFSVRYVKCYDDENGGQQEDLKTVSRGGETQSKAADKKTEETKAESSADLMILDELSASYPYDMEAELPIKLSVSDIKHEKMLEEGVLEPWNTDVVHLGTGGAELGTLYHKVMRFIPFSIKTSGEVKAYLDRISGKEALITKEEKNRLDPVKFARLLESSLCGRMRKAEENGKLWRERQFMIGMPACKIDPVKYAGRYEMITVQGVIDCYFEEDDRIVILDYKTDALPENGMNELVKRYHSQLELYAAAVFRITGISVKEGILYSFTLDDFISLDVSQKI